MTTLIVVDAPGSDFNLTVARRIREELGRVGTNINRVAKSVGAVQQRYSRRMTGKTPWPIDELYEFCNAAGISFAYVATGIRPVPSGPNDGLLLPRMDSNHQPPDLKNKTSLKASTHAETDKAA